MEGKGKREERRTRRGKKAEKERIPDMLQEIRQRKKKKNHRQLVIIILMNNNRKKKRTLANEHRRNHRPEYR